MKTILQILFKSIRNYEPRDIITTIAASPAITPDGLEWFSQAN